MDLEYGAVGVAFGVLQFHHIQLFDLERGVGPAIGHGKLGSLRTGNGHFEIGIHLFVDVGLLGFVILDLDALLVQGPGGAALTENHRQIS